MENSEFKKVLRRTLEAFEFKYINKCYCRENEKLMVVVDIQKSNHSNCYYINYGFWVKAIHDEKTVPKTYNCDLMGRMPCYRLFKKEYDFNMDNMNAYIVATSVKKSVKNILLPVLNEGIEKYFEIFPNAHNAAKIGLKNYLKEMKYIE